jgi:UrcA family protein
MFDRNYSKLLLAAFAGLGLSASANAENLTVTGMLTPTARVSLAGIDLETIAGQEQADGRIRAAANGLCSSSSVEPVAVRTARMACKRNALASGRQALERIVARKALGSSHVATAITITAR